MIRGRSHVLIITAQGSYCQTQTMDIDKLLARYNILYRKDQLYSVC